MPDREKVIAGLEFTKAMITFNPLTGEDIEPENLNEENKTTYDACVGAITLLKEQEAVKPVLDEQTGRIWLCGKCGSYVGFEDNLQKYDQLKEKYDKLLKEQEAVSPRRIDGKRNHFIKCGNCNYDLVTGFQFCPHCGRAVKWE